LSSRALWASCSKKAALLRLYEESKARFIPHVVEPSAGVDRTVLALLFAPKEGEEIRDDMTSMMEKRMRMVESQLSDLRANLEDRVASLS